MTPIVHNIDEVIPTTSIVKSVGIPGAARPGILGPVDPAFDMSVELGLLPTPTAMLPLTRRVAPKGRRPDVEAHQSHSGSLAVLSRRGHVL
jgi:hypothetical protein